MRMLRHAERKCHDVVIQSMKTCRICNVEKDGTEFYKHGQTSDGLNSYCKPCTIARVATWGKNNPSKIAVNKKKWARKNQPKLTAATKKWKAANREFAKVAQERWNKAHPAQANVRNSRHRASKLRATPAWANEFYIAEIYNLAQLRTEVTGFEWEVDHSVPLRSKYVCGLHVEHNLQVIPALDNARKGNRHWPDMPELRM